MSALAILVPVLRRPHRVAPLLNSIRATTPDAQVLFIADEDDEEEKAAIRGARLRASARRDPAPIILVTGGNYAHKINEGVRATDAPLLFLGADDLHFHPGWFEGARALLSDTVGVVGTNDLCSARVQAGEHATHSLVARWYTDLGTIDEPDRLLHEGYDHSFVDDEFVATAKHRAAWAHATGSIVQHLHPDNGGAEWDETYEKGRARMRLDRKRFRRREPLWR